MTEDPDGSARTGQFLGWESGTINRLLYDVMPRPRSTSPIRTKVFVIFCLGVFLPYIIAMMEPTGVVTYLQIQCCYR